MFWNSFILTLRSLEKNRLITILNIIGFTIGLSIFTIIVLWINYEWNFDRFHKNAEEIYRVVEEIDKKGNPDNFAHTPAPLGPLLKNEIPQIINFVRESSGGKQAINYRDKQVWAKIMYTDSSFFKVFDFEFLSGSLKKTFLSPKAIIISKHMANLLFHDNNPIGEKITMGVNYKKEYIISGIMDDFPKNTAFNYDIIIPFSSIHENHLRWGIMNYATYILLTNVNEIKNLEVKINKVFQEKNPSPDIRLHLQPFTDIHLFSKLRGDSLQNYYTIILLYASIGIIVLILASINYTNLNLAVLTSRNKEIGIKKTIGAHKNQIICQLMYESIIIVFISFIIALVLINILLPNFNTYFINENFDYLEFFNPSSIFILIILIVIVGILNGVYPAFIIANFKPIKMIKKEYDYNTKFKISLRKMLLFLQFSTAIFFVSITLLFKTQINFLNSKELGFKKENIIVLPILHNEVRAKIHLFKQDLQELPEVKKTGLTSFYPTERGYGQNIIWENSGNKFNKHIKWIAVDYNFLELMNINITEGRFFNKEIKSDENSYLINKKAVNFLGLKNTVGSYIDINGKGQIIGIVENFHFQSLHNNIQPLAIKYYPDYCNHLYIRITPNFTNIAIEKIKSKWNKLFPNRTFEYTFLEQNLAEVYKKETSELKSLNFISMLIIFIAIMGVLGLSILIANNKIKEIGIRKVNGARTFEIIDLLNRDFLKWVVLANFISSPIAWYAMKSWLRNFAYQTPIYWWVFLLAGTIVMVIVLLTVSLQSLRVAMRNPVEALKYE